MSTRDSKKAHPIPFANARVGQPSNALKGATTVSHDNSWNDQIARGRRLVSEIGDRKWELGDLANEVCAAGANGVHNDDLLGKFASGIGITPSSLREYRRVAAAWPAATRVAAQTWTTHRILSDDEARFEIIAEQTWTYNSLSERLGRLPNPSRVNRGTGEIIREPEPTHRPSAQVAISEALASSSQTESLLNSPETTRLVRAAIEQNPSVAIEARKALDEKYENAPKPITQPEPSPTDDALDLVVEFRKLHRGVDQIVQLVNEGRAVVSSGTRDAILREVKWLRTALGYIEDGVSSDSLEKEIAVFLESQR